MTFVENPGIAFDRLPRPLLAEHPHWVALHDLAWRLASEHIRQIPQGRRHMDAAWDSQRNYQWVWDTCFISLYCRYAADQFPGIQSLDNFYEMQREDGYISMTYDLDKGVEPYPDRINPPLFAWAEWEYFRTTGDASRLSRVAERIERLMTWIEINRKSQPHYRRLAPDAVITGHDRLEQKCQLYWFEDGGSSGMDDSPRSPRRQEAGKFFDWVDLSCQVALAWRHLGLMHGQLGDAERARRCTERAGQIAQVINEELWCPATRFYHDRMIPTNFVPSKTIAGFWPMLTGFCPPERVTALIEHLSNPREFNRPTPIPSLSADDPNYCPHGTYWTGGVWAPTNYMVLRGLAQCGRGDVAHHIALRYLQALHEIWRDHEPHTLWECCSPESSAPGRAAYTSLHVKPHYVGWSGLGPIAVLIEDILGIDLDGVNRHIRWTIRLTEEHGLEQLRIPGGYAHLRCAKRDNGASPAEVELRADAPMRFTIQCGERSREAMVEPGGTVRLSV